MLSASKPALRPVDLCPPEIEIHCQPDGTIRARSPRALPAYAESVTVRLDHWAAFAPERAFLAERAEDGAWQALTYRAARIGARALGQALLERGLDAAHPLLILMGNGIAHALLALAALYVGIPYAPLPAFYARAGQASAKLRKSIARLTPGLICVERTDALAALPADVPLLACASAEGRYDALDFASLLETVPTPAVDQAHARIGAGTVAKLLFTSGSTGDPKPVITTHGMLCANQAMIADVLRFLRSEPPVLVDWLPWHHSFGGNHNFGIALEHGGTLYIDRGRPTPDGIDATLANLREIAPTLFFNVPQGYEMLLPHLESDEALAANFFSALKLAFFAGAALAPKTIARLDAVAARTCGERIAMISGFGATETSPSVLFCTAFDAHDPLRPPVGLPLPGNELKLVPIDHGYEARVRGPHVTPGYWRDPARTQQVFDEEGFYRLGDALRLADSERPQRGFVFEGRLGESFKLASGTTVAAAALRAQLVAKGAPYIRDAVIAGENRDAIAALIFPDLAACRALAADLPASAAAAAVLARPAVRQRLEASLAELAAEAGGSSQRIARAALLAELPSAEAGELTEKGTLNPRAVLRRHADLVEALYAGAEGPLILNLLPAEELAQPSLAAADRT